MAKTKFKYKLRRRSISGGQRARPKRHNTETRVNFNLRIIDPHGSMLSKILLDVCLDVNRVQLDEPVECDGSAQKWPIDFVNKQSPSEDYLQLVVYNRYMSQHVHVYESPDIIKKIVGRVVGYNRRQEAVRQNEDTR